MRLHAVKRALLHTASSSYVVWLRWAAAVQSCVLLPITQPCSHREANEVDLV